MWVNGRFVGHGLAELVEKARRGKSLTRDEGLLCTPAFRIRASFGAFLHAKPKQDGSVSGVALLKPSPLYPTPCCHRHDNGLLPT
jgi:hypothetical protein